ncbi:hypothetical protein [Halalkalibacter hemicellulosilyticus]|uniref:hypothetical protein n=1 Tax=Halalkalibacter hemicellulosilyticus TaxID=127886 RepID=UPI000556927E|nr:hypothetical protein [Halalkalibacter hemicellulosilyticus]
MDWNDNYLEREKTKLLTKIGCLFGVVILGLLAILVVVWYISNTQETQLKVSHSPNNINSIEIVKKNDFPDPTLRINYDNRSIMKTKIPDKISVEWEDDYKAIVILTKKGRETDIVNIEFAVNPNTEE